MAKDTTMSSLAELCHGKHIHFNKRRARAPILWQIRSGLRMYRQALINEEKKIRTVKYNLNILNYLFLYNKNKQSLYKLLSDFMNINHDNFRMFRISDV